MEVIDENILIQIFEKYKGVPGFIFKNSWEEFRDFVIMAYPVLIEAAKQNILITYKNIAGKIGLSLLSPHFQTKIGFIVGTCSDYEDLKGHPLLSAIVINETTKYPGRMKCWYFGHLK